MRRTLVASIVFVLGGCSWSDVMVQEMKGIPPGSSFGFQQGYRDGCRTGIARTGGVGFDKPSATRDERRLKTESDYRSGWDQGERNCAERYAGAVLTSRRGDRYQP